jgi:hypothetical protein
MTSPSAAEIRGWLTGRIPTTWFEGPVEVTTDRDEILVVGVVPAPVLPDEAGDAERAAAVDGRIRQFREDTRGRRIEIARELEHRTGSRVSWGARCGATSALFTTASVPVMTRLRQPERLVLDTLVEAGVARSRSDALAWCVRLVGRNSETWLADLREALRRVEDVRGQGPEAS